MATAVNDGIHHYASHPRRGFVATFVPVEAVRVVQQAAPDIEPVELALFDVGDADLMVAAGPVPKHSEQSTITAYDSAHVADRHRGGGGADVP